MVQETRCRSSDGPGAQQNELISSKEVTLSPQDLVLEHLHNQLVSMYFTGRAPRAPGGVGFRTKLPQSLRHDRCTVQYCFTVRFTLCN